MIKIAACCLALVLGLYVSAVGLYSALPTHYGNQFDSQFEVAAHPTQPVTDEPSLAVLAKAPALPTATVAAPQSILTEDIFTDIFTGTSIGTFTGNVVNVSNSAAELLPEVEATPTAQENSPALAPAMNNAAALPTVTPQPAVVLDPTPPPTAIAYVEPINHVPVNGASAGCWVTEPPPSLGLDPFYTKYCAALGIPIVASSEVPDAALQRAWSIVTHMLNGIEQAEELRASIIHASARIGIIGAAQATTDMPEHRTLYALFPGVDWDTRARGVGATQEIPLLSIAEENLLCYPGDQWRGQNVLVHEFAHTIKNLGLDLIDPTFHAEVQRAYQQALAAGLWPATYVSSDLEEYWAEGVRLYFQIDAAGVPGGQSYPANSRAELQHYDPELYRLVERVFGPHSGIAPCPT